MIWAIVQLSTKETQFFCVMKVIDGGVLPEFPIEEFDHNQQMLLCRFVNLERNGTFLLMVLQPLASF